MWINRNRMSQNFLFFFLAALVLSSCASDKKTVEPYPDDSYTSSVARMPSGTSSPTQAPEEIMREQTLVNAPDRQQEQPSGQDSSKTMLSLLTLVDDRIVAYEGKVEQWDKIIAEASTVTLDMEQQDTMTACQRQLMGILNGYNELHRLLIGEGNGQTVDVPITQGFLVTERQDMNFLESTCQQIILSSQQAGGWVAVTRERLLEEKERELHDKMAAGEYQQVVELYARLPLAKGQRPSFTTVYEYGQALLRTGRENDAVKVLQDLLIGLQQQNQLEREFKLMQLIADIQFGMENYDKAFERYIDIINRYAGLGENIDWARKQQSVISARNSRGIEVRSFAELMRSYLAYNADRDGFRVFFLATRFLADFSESSMIPTVNHILFESRDRAEEWFALVLQRVNVLKGEKKYQEALRFIEQLPKQGMPTEKKERLESLANELISVSTEEEESRRRAVEGAMEQNWSTGENYLREKEYDRAIETFSTLLTTTYADRANDKILEASQLAAQEDRRKAAELFVLSGKTAERDNKIALLLQSRQLLKGILKKYPRSGLIEKTEKNLERIEEEIRSIDPALLTEPEGTADDQQFLQQPGSTTDGAIPPVGDWKDQAQPGFPRE